MTNTTSQRYFAKRQFQSGSKSYEAAIVWSKQGLHECIIRPKAFSQRDCRELAKDCILQEDSFSEKTFRQIAEYFKGKRQQFDLPLKPEGTDFQKKVWQQLAKIPYGQTRTYGDIARRAGSPKGARAVGMGCNRNPIGVIIPCHRVVGTNGQLTGFAGGLPMKESLLKHEGATNY